MSDSDLLLPAWGLLGASALTAAVWLRQKRTRNAGFVDVAWTAAIGGLGVFYAVLADGWIGRRVLLGAIVAAWALRLGAHLWKRVCSEPEDGRYAALREEKGAAAQTWFFWFFQAQALLAALLSLAFWIPMTAPEAGWRIADLAALGVFAVSLAGETVADRQLAAFRAEPSNRGRTCRVGLWSWSRHPNYFFEWLHWLVYPIASIGLPLGLVPWFAPALMLFLVLRVTGIPPTEARALRSRGDDYREYQRTVNAFFPGPPKARASQHAS